MNIRVMMVDDEPLIRKVVKMEMNERAAEVESGDVDGTEMRRVEMVETFADGPSLARLSACGYGIPGGTHRRTDDYSAGS